MDINQINGLYQSKITEINQRLPQTGTVQNKFQNLLEKAQLTTTTENITTTESISTNSETDPVKLINSLMATQSSINATSALFGSSDTSSLFSTSSLNSTMLSMQQNALLQALNKQNDKE